MLNEYLPLNGHFFLRGKSTGDVMMIGILEQPNIKVPNKGEIWLLQFLVTDIKRYKAPPYLHHKRADQVLCTVVPVEDLEEITS